MTGGTIFSDTVFVAHTRKCLLHVMLDECLLQSHVRFYILAVSGNWRDNCPMHMYYAAWEMLYRAKCNMGIYGSCHVLTCKYLDDVLDLNIIVLSSESEDINEGSSKGNVPKEDINGGPSKGKLPPLGSSARPRPEVGPKLAKLFNNVHVVKSASKKAIFKSPQTIIGVVLGLANLKTWDDIVQKMGKRPLGSYANKGKGKAKV
ncbi:hypothetical protein Tco_1292044 [Tanacetum coccineum]